LELHDPVEVAQQAYPQQIVPLAAFGIAATLVATTVVLQNASQFLPATRSRSRLLLATRRMSLVLSGAASSPRALNQLDALPDDEQAAKVRRAV
jgi:hypothetical protein